MGARGEDELMEYAGSVDYFDEVRSARVGLEAALAVSESEPARAAWRLYHQVLSRLPESNDIRDACRVLDEAITRSEDEQLIDAKQRYDLALRGTSRAADGQ
jgi:hypothetical protein